MCIAIIAPGRDLSEWKEEFTRNAQDIPLVEWPDIENYQEVQAAVVWGHPQGVLKDFPNLKVICSMGAGVDHILSDPELPEGVPITRIVDDELSFSMSNYIILACLYYQRKMDRFLVEKEQKLWDQASAPERDIRIGILGMGALGEDAAKKLMNLGFYVAGYARSPKDVRGLTSYHGEDQLPAFLKDINVLVCLLPLTKASEGVLSKPLFDQMTPGTYLINVARGGHQIEKDILEAIESEQLSGAFLDVFQEEPLPKDHPFWEHPKVMITPHIACITKPGAAVPAIINNYRRMQAGKSLESVVDIKKGY